MSFSSKSNIKLIALLLITYTSLFSLAEDNIQLSEISKTKKQTNLILYVLEFEGITQKNKKGAYDFLLSDLSLLTGIAHDYQVLPTGRGANLFYQNKQACVIPSSTYVGYYANSDVIHSEIISTIDYLSFTHPNSDKISSEQDLENKTIGVIRDEDAWDYATRFNLSHVSYYKTNDLQSLIHMLYKKRIDVAIHDASDFINLTKKLGYPTPNYNKNFLIAQDGIAITCHNNEFNQNYIKKITPHLKHLIKHNLKGYFEKTLQ